MLSDAIQVATIAVSIYAIINWRTFIRRWPITLAVIAALLVNLAFYAGVIFGSLPREDHNLLSAIRAFLMALVIAALPSSLRVYIK